MPWKSCKKTLLLLPQSFLNNVDTVYWIGLQKSSLVRLSGGRGVRQQWDHKCLWFWVDGSLYEQYPWHVQANTSCPNPFSSSKALRNILNSTSTQCLV